MKRDGFIPFLCLPTLAMSLGWALRGTIGGGQIGAMIPGAIVALCLCYLLGITRQVGLITAISAVGIGLGGQETYGQTIGFLKNPDTVAWGLLGLTLKGAMWGLSGGVLVGLAFCHRKFRLREVVVGLGLMIAGTLLGWWLVDVPRLFYFSNLEDKPRPELWVGLTLGGLFLWAYLYCLKREAVTTAFAWGGWLAGGLGFGGGSIFLAIGNALPAPYQKWGWWKMMEFSFGAIFGLGLGLIAYGLRHQLRELAQDPPATLAHPAQTSSSKSDLPARWMFPLCIVLGELLAVGGVWANHTIPHRASFTFVAAGLILLVWKSNSLAWHVALSMTCCGFLRDFLYFALERKWIDETYANWITVACLTLPIVIIVAWGDGTQRLSIRTRLLGLLWFATAFGLIKLGILQGLSLRSTFVPSLFFVEAVLSTLLIWMISPPEPVSATKNPVP